MLSYAATFLMVAIILGALGFSVFTGTYAFGAKVVAVIFAVLSLTAFSVEHRHGTTS